MNDISDGTLRRDWAVEPGVVLSQILAERGLRQTDLSERTGLSTKYINQIIKNKVPISGDTAAVFELALGVSANFWTRLAADWEAHKSVERVDEALPSYAAWAKSFNRTALLTNSIIRQSDSAEDVTKKLLQFFAVASPKAFRDTYMRPQVSFRRAQTFEVKEPDTALWLRLIELKALGTPAPSFNATTLRKTSKLLPRLSTLPVTEGFIEARRLLATAGVSLAFVPEIPRTRICAATWWFGAETPVIGLTGRHKKLDTLWFNLMHEVGHVLLHPRRTTFLDLDEAMKGTDGAEQQANQFAQDSLIPPKISARFEQIEDSRELAGIASELGVNLSVVAGQYAFRTHRYAAVAKYRPSLTSPELAELSKT